MATFVFLHGADSNWRGKAQRGRFRKNGLRRIQPEFAIQPALANRGLFAGRLLVLRFFLPAK